MNVLEANNYIPNFISTIIPAEAKNHVVRLSGIPKQTGELVIDGIVVRMLGGSIEEVIHQFEKKGSGVIVSPSQHIRKPLEFVSAPSKVVQLSHEPVLTKATIVGPQPFLELQSTSLGIHRAIQCFQGEKTKFTITVKNIGVVPINIISISFKEQQIPSIQQDADEQSPAYIYEKLIYEKNINACQIENIEEDGIIIHDKSSGVLPVYQTRTVIERNEIKTFNIGVFGKNNVSGVTVHMQYGSIGNEEGDNGNFFTRDLYVPILITVGAPLIIRNTDFLVFSE